MSNISHLIFFSSAISVGFVQLLASLLSGLLIDVIGRIPLLICSSVFMSLALASFGSYYHYEHHNGSPDMNSDWIPLLCVLIFTIAFSLGNYFILKIYKYIAIIFYNVSFRSYLFCSLLGISPISWLLVGEIFPLEVFHT